jgi:hypothetical protein
MFQAAFGLAVVTVEVVVGMYLPFRSLSPTVQQCFDTFRRKRSYRGRNGKLERYLIMVQELRVANSLRATQPRADEPYL